MASRFLQQLRSVIRTRGYSSSTERAYVDWARRFIRFHNLKHPAELHDAEVIAFLTHLAVDRKVSAGTQNQALNALVFMYRHVLKLPLGDITAATRAKRPLKLPVVLTRQEVRLILNNLEGVHRLIASLLYGSGLRLLESLRLRVKDLDFEYRSVHVHNGKGQKDRIVALPDTLVKPLQRHLHQVQMIHESDIARGLGGVQLPNALARKYKNANREFKWQYVFPASRPSVTRAPGFEADFTWIHPRCRKLCARL